ncbi:uncharacterized protein LOC129582690 isoform X2 [Paramacrobiotus metropolitanus]|nr:uncharacterized protein LOC129582690 isoform X2 [Paramacrobiotus metropolitanus]XP_055330249.1 uncharacterized protein LOC129582690 isoform X2 [Paramacrobiotus metropolitanus]XP_055330250.1 uncharacterized protein LOC129582690 isoform X2 [Paramacrobiotus metropolitanus]XP_055330251.1 uncharacterized protein LOC129582690 isoform X2 [Paramacrobiotus metropolitanus]XP_055330252.1 uncharacterized protein LOC129582690 isoform X2 [Paramacrobiotus metropolitanus]
MTGSPQNSPANGGRIRRLRRSLGAFAQRVRASYRDFRQMSTPEAFSRQDRVARSPMDIYGYQDDRPAADSSEPRALNEDFGEVVAEGFDNLINENTDLKSHVQLLQGRVGDLESMNVKSKEEIVGLKEENVKMKEEIVALKEENVKMKEENVKLKEENKLLGVRVTTIEEQLSKVMQHNPYLVKLAHLPADTTHNELNDTFGAYPSFISAELQNGGYAVIRFSQLDCAVSAAKEINGYLIDDREIKATVESIPKAGLIARRRRSVSGCSAEK